MVESDQRAESPVPSVVQRGVRSVRRSLPRQFAVAGVGLVLAGYLLGKGVWAALLPIWGAGLLVLAACSYAVVLRIR